MTEIQKLASSSSGNAIAQWQVPFDCTICAVVWACYLNMEANNDTLSVELSRQSTSQLGATGVSNVIDMVAVWNNLVTSGMTAGAINRALMGIAVRIQANEVLYLNSSIVGAAAINCFIHYKRGRS